MESCNKKLTYVVLFSGGMSSACVAYMAKQRADKIGGFKFGNGQAMCTTYLKTKPFHKWLKENYPVTKEILKNGELRDDVVFLYGFDKNEVNRIQRRIGVIANMGYKVDFPLAYWNNPVKTPEEFGIKRPITYNLYKHANCSRGCLKAEK